MSIKKRIPVTQGIINAVEETDSSYMNKKPLLHRWAIHAVGMVGHTNLYNRQAIVRTVVDCTVELPENIAHVNAIILGDWGTDCSVFNDVKYYRESEMNYLNSSYVFKWSKAGDVCSITPFPWSIRDNKLVFDCDINDEYITIDALLHDLDMDGIPLMHETDTPVVEKYIKLKIVKIEQFSRYRKGRMTNIDLSYVRQLNAELGMAIKNAKYADSDHAGVHKEFVSQMIHFPISGPGYLNMT